METTINWEQRRYEIAKAMLPAIYLDDGNAQRADHSPINGFEYKTPDGCAKEAVSLADALINELKRKEQTMRTIDFRGKAAGSGRWIHGDLVWNDIVPAIFEDADQENAAVIVQEHTLGMNTGLKDKNGHEIYGGDILAHKGNILGYVVDGVRGYCFDVVYITPEGEKSCPLYEVVSNFSGKLEIVGNIHDISPKDFHERK